MKCVGIGEVTDPALRIESSENMTVVRFHNHKSSPFVVAALVETLRSVKLKCNYTSLVDLPSVNFLLRSPVLHLLQVLPSLEFFLSFLQFLGVRVEKFGFFNGEVRRHYFNQKIYVEVFRFQNPAALEHSF